MKVVTCGHAIHEITVTIGHTPIVVMRDGEGTLGAFVNACGDMHVANFGVYASAERNLVFDINDFDETLPAPWEWDIKRLAVSFAVAARDNDHADTTEAAIRCAVQGTLRTSHQSAQSSRQTSAPWACNCRQAASTPGRR